MTTAKTIGLVTGAGSGIGRVVARHLDAMGCAVALVGRTQATLDETAEGLSGESLVIEADVADPDQAGTIVAAVLERFGRLDHLVNNAGTAPVYPIDETTPARLAAVFGVNTLGTGRLIAAAWPTFVAQGGGCIVNLSSMATADPFPGFFAYAASKAGVEAMALSCAMEGAEHGIRAFAVAPGAVETAMLREIVSHEDWPTDQCLTPEAVAAEIIACIKGERDACNGQTIRLPNPPPNPPPNPS